jgi:hypothetical protein
MVLSDLEIDNKNLWQVSHEQHSFLSTKSLPTAPHVFAEVVAVPSPPNPLIPEPVPYSEGMQLFSRMVNQEVLVKKRVHLLDNLYIISITQKMFFSPSFTGRFWCHVGGAETVFHGSVWWQSGREDRYQRGESLKGQNILSQLHKLIIGQRRTCIAE